MPKVCCLALLCCCASLCARAELTLSPNTTWEYQVTNLEMPKGGNSSMIVRAVGTDKAGEKELVRLETRVDNALTKTEAVAADEHGLVCYQRTSTGGQVTPFNPPQTIVPNPISLGTKWETDEGNNTHLQFDVVAEEEIVVPAGKFHAFRAQCEQPWPISMKIERWVVPGIGMIKEVTSTRGPGGRLLGRVTTALTKFSGGNSAVSEPGLPATLQSNSRTAGPNFTLEIAREREGPPVEEIKADVLNLFVRWRGENVPVDSMVRIAWVADDVGNLVDRNFVIDEKRMRVLTPNPGTRFTLSRPKDGWANGKYRVDLYLDDQLAASSEITIRN